jgi:molecular chaperone DnaJ
LECHGRGRTKTEKTITLKIPPGVDTGSQLRLQAEGEPGEYGGPPGDLFVVIHVKEHEFFKREGDHLFCEVPISFVQAALGNTMQVPVLGEEKVKDFEIPSGTQPGDVFTLAGHGMPSLQRSRKGDLFIKVNVKIPKRLNQHQRELLEEFAKTDGLKQTKSEKSFWQKISKP